MNSGQVCEVEAKEDVPRSPRRLDAALLRSGSRAVLAPDLVRMEEEPTSARGAEVVASGLEAVERASTLLERGVEVDGKRIEDDA